MSSRFVGAKPACDFAGEDCRRKVGLHRCCAHRKYDSRTSFNNDASTRGVCKVFELSRFVIRVSRDDPSIKFFGQVSGCMGEGIVVSVPKQ